jgi:hypothetical protein
MAEYASRLGKNPNAAPFLATPAQAGVHLSAARTGDRLHQSLPCLKIPSDGEMGPGFRRDGGEGNSPISVSIWILS